MVSALITTGNITELIAQPPSRFATLKNGVYTPLTYPQDSSHDCKRS